MAQKAREKAKESASHPILLLFFLILVHNNKFFWPLEREKIMELK